MRVHYHLNIAHSKLNFNSSPSFSHLEGNWNVLYHSWESCNLCHYQLRLEHASGIEHVGVQPESEYVTGKSVWPL